MSWAPIAWSELSWEAFATLATGVLAVAAAAWVGAGQLRLQRRQTELLEAAERRSNDLFLLENWSRVQSNNLALLDRRIEFIESFRSIYTEWSQDGKLSRESLHQLRKLGQIAILIFDKEKSNAIFECFVKLSESQRLQTRANSYQGINNFEKSQADIDRAYKLEDEASSLIPNIFEQIQESSKIESVFRSIDRTT
jgi:hypothetical protein